MGKGGGTGWGGVEGRGENADNCNWIKINKFKKNNNNKIKNKNFKKEASPMGPYYKKKRKEKKRK